ncbi:uncharacterized protein LOC119690159 [Teleopsis dalmanni]|uniref:uncharacterized protein LOC119690159 n=1 Tax=Teleopsis dalmanni TaxID=139649 RepID=UPI0018CE82C3|nr:uncharacterized protein LOC119690159 [Teleopsis dalmanni]
MPDYQEVSAYSQNMTVAEKINMLRSVFERYLKSLDFLLTCFMKCAQSEDYNKYINIYPNDFKTNNTYDINALRAVIEEIPPLIVVWKRIKSNEIHRLKPEVLNLLFWLFLEKKCANIFECTLYDIVELRKLLPTTTMADPDYVFKILPTTDRFNDVVKQYHDVPIHTAFFDPQMETFFHIFSKGFDTLDKVILRNDFERAFGMGEKIWMNSMLGTKICCVGVVSFVAHSERMKVIENISDHCTELYDSDLANLKFIMVYKTKDPGLVDKMCEVMIFLYNNKKAIILGSMVAIVGKFIFKNGKNMASITFEPKNVITHVTSKVHEAFFIGWKVIKDLATHVCK